jgi:class 3 adenylate cyclase
VTLSVFLFTDIVGSTAKWAAQLPAMAAALERHDQILAGAISDAGGSVFKHTGDGCAAVFPTAAGAVVAAASALRALAGVDWGELGELQVRMGVHAGDGSARDGDWFGPALNRCARLMGIAHGGQILVSGACQALLDVMPAGLSLLDLGMHRLRDLTQPEHVWQLTGPDLSHGFPPLRSLDAFRGRLPSRLSLFIGREREQRDLSAALATNRLLTLVGPGGMGKTRLGLQVAAGAVDRFAEGVWFVELAPVG